MQNKFENIEAIPHQKFDEMLQEAIPGTEFTFALIARNMLDYIGENGPSDLRELMSNISGTEHRHNLDKFVVLAFHSLYQYNKVSLLADRRVGLPEKTS